MVVAARPGIAAAADIAAAVVAVGTVDTAIADIETAPDIRVDSCRLAHLADRAAARVPAGIGQISAGLGTTRC